MNYKAINVKTIILIVFLLHVAGVNAEEVENDVVYDFTPSKDEATIYIYREWRFVLGGVDFDIFLNDELIGTSENGSVISMKAKPGIHDFWITQGGVSSLFLYHHKEVILEKGKNYFYEIDATSDNKLYEKEEMYSKNEIISITDKEVISTDETDE